MIPMAEDATGGDAARDPAEYEGIDAAMAAVDEAVEPAEGVTFDAPWQARAFGVAVALHEREGRDFSRFQERFVERIQSTDPEAMQDGVEATYYERWLEALEELLVEEGLVSEAELDRRAAAFTEGERDAAEFVVDPGRVDGGE